MKALLGLVCAGLLALSLAVEGARGATTTASRPIPVLAYYYIWYGPSTWTHGKSDYPLLGRYSSNNEHVLEQHVKWAKAAGIDGFIVSWKNTPSLDARLSLLVQVADRLHFRLAVIYQGLDYHRRPLATARVESDLKYFVSRFAADDAFQIYSKPLVIWSGTWKFSSAQVARVTDAVRPKLLVLGSEKSVSGYDRIAPSVDGDAYYWSSVDPLTYPGYPGKLVDMAAAVHARQGLWIAPVAPGFDARLVGGHIVVPRRKGQTLRAEFDGAERSNPDAIGLISWNEFSENSQVEPSRRFGMLYLHVLGSILGGPSATIDDFSSDNSAGHGGNSYGPAVAAGAGVALAGLIGLVLMRARRGRLIGHETVRDHAWQPRDFFE